MSFRNLGAITNKAKLQAERERGYTNDEEAKSSESRAFKMFSEGKSPVEVAILLDLAADRVRAIYRDELTGRFELAQIYDEARYDLRGLFRLHKILKDLGFVEKDIIKVLELAKYDDLENLQWKVEYLRKEVNMIEVEKWKSTKHILKLNRIMDEFQPSLPQSRGWYDNTDNLYPRYTEPNTSSYSIQLSYSDYWS